MKKIFSKKQPDLLLHVINRGEEIVGRKDLSEEDQFLQVAALRMPLGKTFRPHQHIWKDNPTQQCIAQESWVVVQGSVKVSLFDIDGTHLQNEVIRLGDCSITFQGGHTYEILQPDTVVYEFKTGPYQGPELDKVFL